MSTEQRREQLLTIGARLFAEQPYDEVWVEKVAERAQVSRGLLYHYFPTKRDFLVAILRAEHQRMLERTAPDPSLPPIEQLRAGLRAYVENARRFPDAYRVVHQARAGGNADIHAVCEEFDTLQQQRILVGISQLVEETEMVALAVRGWLDFVSATVVRWLEHQPITCDELCELCVRALVAAVGATPGGLGQDMTESHSSLNANGGREGRGAGDRR